MQAGVLVGVVYILLAAIPYAIAADKPLVIDVCHYLPFFLAASRLTEYAIATLCLMGFPDFTSAAMFFLNADLLVDLTKGTVNSPSNLLTVY